MSSDPVGLAGIERMRTLVQRKGTESEDGWDRISNGSLAEAKLGVKRGRVTTGDQVERAGNSFQSARMET